MNSVGHIEIPTTDFKTAKKFFGKLFGWKFQEVPDWDYMLFYAPKKPHGGFYHVKKMPKIHTVLLYIETDSIDKKLKQIKLLKGKILSRKTPIGKAGWWVKFQTPDGCHLALWESVKKK
jgi:uncharacterized protein